LKITGIIWLDDIVAELEQKHGVKQDEVEEIFLGKPWFRFVEKGHRPGEKCLCRVWANRCRAIL